MSESEGDKSYMSMLNNPFINSVPEQKQEQKINNKLKSCTVPQEVKATLISASQDKYLVSESDEPFEWVNTASPFDHLPKNTKELMELGFVEDVDTPIKIKSLDAFFSENQGLESIFDAFKKLQGESQVYLIGEPESRTVLILCHVESALVGLKSLLVQT